MMLKHINTSRHAREVFDANRLIFTDPAGKIVRQLKFATRLNQAFPR